MKKTLLALALFAFAGTAAFAQEGQGKDAKKAVAAARPKSSCSMEAKASMAGGGSSCCMKGAKVAAAKPAVKAPAVVKL